MAGVNLLTLAERVARLDTPPIRLEAGRCLHSLNKDTSCRTCVEVCPVDAITLEGGVTLNAESCVACGACLPACPTGTFTGEDGVADLIRCVASLEPGLPVELVCAQHPDPARGNAAAAVVRTPRCLAALGPSAYLGLFSAGVREIGVRLDACAHCPLVDAATAIAQTVATARELLAHCDLDGSITLLDAVSRDDVPPQQTRPVTSTQNPPLSRRGLFRTLANQGSRHAARLLSHDAALADVQGPSRERRRLILALRHLPLSEELQPLDVPGFARYGVTDECSGCGICAHVCPTAALRFYRDDAGDYQLIFTPAACIDCDLCQSVCAPAALVREAATVADLLDPDEWILAAGRLRTCVKCKTQFAATGDETLCPLCAFRRKHPFGSTLPPGLSRTDLLDRIQGRRNRA